jgi:hypothetical protein
VTSPKTRPTVQQRWPRGAESQRRQIYEMAEDGRELVKEALKALDRGNPNLVRVSIAFLESVLSDIQRLAVEARIGAEAPGQEGHDD